MYGIIGGVAITLYFMFADKIPSSSKDFIKMQPLGTPTEDPVNRVQLLNPRNLNFGFANPDSKGVSENSLEFTERPVFNPENNPDPRTWKQKLS